MAKKKATKRKAAKKKKATAKRSAAKPKAKPKRTARKKSGKSNAQSVRNELAAIQADEEIVKLYRAGYGASEIALLLEKRPTDITLAVQRVRKRWREELLGEYDELVGETVARNQLVLRLALEGYEKSRDQPDVTVTQTEHTDGSSISRQERHTPAGDPRFLSLFEKANTNIAAILGIQNKTGHDNASSDAKVALIEVVIDSREELAQLQAMDYKTLEAVAVKRKG